MKLDQMTSLFYAIKIDGRLRDALATAKLSARPYFDGSTEEFLRIVAVGTGKHAERWIGKIVSPGPSAGELEDVQRNILSILRRIAPDVHVPATALRLFVLHGVEGKVFVADEPPTVEDEDPAMRRVMYG
jgi:hypothetical protein